MQMPKLERVCVLTVAEQSTLDPDTFVAKLKAAGFVFVSETCPIKLRKPWSAHRLSDGSFEYRQTILFNGVSHG